MSVPRLATASFGSQDLRLGEKLHREVALHAAEENLSINQWVVRKLSRQLRVNGRADSGRSNSRHFAALRRRL
jgi:hypothetical protein